MAEIKKVKASTIPDITDLTGYKVFGIKKNIDDTVDNGLAPMELLLAGTPAIEFSLNENGELVYEITYTYIPR